MVLLKIAVKDNRLIKVRDRLIIEDTINGVDCHFEFRSDWSALKTTVVFARGHIYPVTKNPQTITVSLDDNNECTVPPEVISERGEFSIGLIGENDKTRIVTNWLYYQARSGCYDVVTPPNPPTPSEYDKILGALNNKSDVNHKHDEYITDEEMTSAIEEVKKYADDNDADTRYGIVYDSSANKIKLTNDASKNEINIDEFVHEGLNGISATHSWNGTVLTITSASGTSSADLKGEAGRPGTDGKDGKDGYTPIKGVDYFDGKDGADGKDGYTPVKGIDYFDGKDGKDGVDGETPTIEISEDGYWVINGVKTEYKAVGTGGAIDNGGIVPTIAISDDGYWVINGEKTEYKAIGTDGKDGKDGYTPIKGKDYFDGEPGYTPVKGVDYFDGEPGKDGYTPVKGVDYFDGQPGVPGNDGFTPYVQDGYWYINGVNTEVKAQGKDGISVDIINIKESTESGGVNVITFSNGVTLSIQNGTDGEDGYTPVKDVDYFDGKDGYTPIKGVDYYTEQEKQALSDAILEMLKNTVKVAKIGEVTLLADAWVGEENLYSQVVSIEGVTENSQVDLTPDVQQLAVFYNKDLTFVTENEGGVVTVYAIGQKPTNDYTIQVTITEVDV